MTKEKRIIPARIKIGVIPVRYYSPSNFFHYTVWVKFLAWDKLQIFMGGDFPVQHEIHKKTRILFPFRTLRYKNQMRTILYLEGKPNKIREKLEKMSKKFEIDLDRFDEYFSQARIDKYKVLVKLR